MENIIQPLVLKHQPDDLDRYYIIPLNNQDHILTREVLLANYDINKLRKQRWSMPEISLEGFGNGIINLKVVLAKMEYQVSVLSEPDRLHVKCSCGDSDNLCFHAYKLLDRILNHYDETDYFSNFRRNGPAELASGHKKYFSIINPQSDFRIQSKRNLGHVYGFNNPCVKASLPDLVNLPRYPKLTRPVEEFSICYMIMLPQKSYGIPFLLPAMGKLNKAGTDITSFGQFLGGLAGESKLHFTEEQQLLNDTCFQLFKLVEKSPWLIGSKLNPGIPDHELLSQVLQYWKIAFPLLSRQLTYTYPYWHPRYLKTAIRKKWTRRIHPVCQQPAPKLHLKESRDYYSARIILEIEGKPDEDLEFASTLFVRKEDRLYMLGSWADAGLVQWFADIDNRLTIFKENYEEFSKIILQGQTQYYTRNNKKVKSKTMV